MANLTTLLLYITWFLALMDHSVGNAAISGLTSDVYYSITEELANGTTFGNLVRDSNINENVNPIELKTIRFSFLTGVNPYSGYFVVTPRSGDLSVGNRIDREAICTYRRNCVLKVSVAAQSDMSPFFRIISVHVVILDINDNPPVFSQTEFSVNIPEDMSIGAKFPLPIAIDRDSGSNNSVQNYFLAESYKEFGLDTDVDGGGIVQPYLHLLTSLNREETSFLTLTVLAQDGGQPPLIGSLLVSVIVTDVNDNYPMFDQDVYNVNVSETATIDDVLVQVHAEDRDVESNGQVMYSFFRFQPQEIFNLFRIQPNSGQLYLIHSLENHADTLFELVVEGRDGGSPPKVSRTLVRVNVLDTVNSRPVIIVDILRQSTDGKAEVSELAELGNVVAYVSVRDPDSGHNGVTSCTVIAVQFGLQTLNDHGQYKIILITSLDREDVESHLVRVICHDDGFPALETVEGFEISVLDENDNSPRFSQRSYATSILENSPPGTLVVHLTATDADIGINGHIYFQVSEAHTKQFSILDNGTMVTSVPLDREMSERLVVKVMAVDEGSPSLTGSTTVFISLQDTNDNPPAFNVRGGSGYVFTLPEDAALGSFVGIVTARDGDDGQNAVVRFSVLSYSADNMLPFTITADGVVNTKKLLDREVEDVYHVIIMAEDGGRPSLSTTTTVIIHVDDVNDNTPYFTFPSVNHDSVVIAHTFPVQAVITQFHALDIDAGYNAAIIYSYVTANDSTLFSVHPRTGQLLLKRGLQPSHVGFYLLQVVAHDEGTPQLSSRAVFTVEVYFDNSTLFGTSNTPFSSSTSLMVLILAVAVAVTVILFLTVFVLCVRRNHEMKKQPILENEDSVIPHKSQGVDELPAFCNGDQYHTPIPEQSLDGGGTLENDLVDSQLVNKRFAILPPHSNYKDSNGPPEIVKISCNGVYHRMDDIYPETDIDDEENGSRFSTFRSQHLDMPQKNATKCHSADEVASMEPKDSISVSELSCASASDSGRGGSEFDVLNSARKVRRLIQQDTPPHSHSEAIICATPVSPRTPMNAGFYNEESPVEVSFSTFRGDSPCSFRFESDTDTLTCGMTGRRNSSVDRLHPPAYSYPSPLDDASANHFSTFRQYEPALSMTDTCLFECPSKATHGIFAPEGRKMSLCGEHPTLDTFLSCHHRDEFDVTDNPVGRDGLTFDTFSQSAHSDRIAGLGGGEHVNRSDFRSMDGDQYDVDHAYDRRSVKRYCSLGVDLDYSESDLFMSPCSLPAECDDGIVLSERSALTLTSHLELCQNGRMKSDRFSRQLSSEV